MALDFELILVLATSIAGVIWLIDATTFARKRHKRSLEQTHGERRDAIKDPGLVEYARSFFPVLLVVLLLRSFVAEPFRIPSGSMLPTLEVGDFIVVNKFTYGVRLPVTHTRILDGHEPERGDVAVFRYPRKPSVDYIKRIVGLPGDTIGYHDRRLYVNDQPVSMQRNGPYEPAEDGPEGLVRFHEDLGEHPHALLLDPDGGSREGEFTVPEGQYFVMGDNRDHSNDSRYWGYVPEQNLVGRAEFIWLHWNWNDGALDWSRIGDVVE